MRGDDISNYIDKKEVRTGVAHKNGYSILLYHIYYIYDGPKVVVDVLCGWLCGRAEQLLVHSGVQLWREIGLHHI